MLILHPASLSTSCSSSDETPVKLVVDADISHLPINMLPPEQWDTANFTSVLPHLTSADEGQRRVIEIGGLDIDSDLDDGQLRSHLLVVFGYSHDKSTSPWSRRPILRTTSCTASTLDEGITMALESDLGVHHSHVILQKKDPDLGALPLDVSVKCKRTLPDGTMQKSEIRIMLQRTSVGANGNGWALVITHDKFDDSTPLHVISHERRYHIMARVPGHPS